MRILAIALGIYNPLSDKSGGANEKILYHLLKEAAKHHDIHVLVSKVNVGTQPDELRASVHFHEFNDKLDRPHRLVQGVLLALYISKLNANYNFDVFHSFSFLQAAAIVILSRILGKKVIFSEFSHIAWVKERRSFLSTVDFWVNIVPSARFADVITAPSRFIKRRIVQLTGCAIRKVIVIPHGTTPPPKVTLPQLFRKKYGIPQERPILTFIGRLVPTKGIHTLIEALYIVKRHFPETQLVIAGPTSGGFATNLQSHASYYNRLQSLAADLQVSENTMFTGFIQVNELYDLLAASTIFVFPSTEEAFGLVLIEAMSMGLPIVTTDSAPMNEIVDQRCGRIIKQADASRLAEAVIELLSNRELYGEISKYNTWKFHRQYEISCMIRKYIELYHQVESRKLI